MLKITSRLCLLGILGVILVGCSNAGGAVDVESVQKQADKEKAINKQGMENIPAGEGPAG